jgi:hypothetical protein
MCMVDMADPCEFWHEKTVRAAKPHVCGECRREIAPGELYQRSFGKYEGRVFYDVTCRHCAVACAWLNRECGGYLGGAVLVDLREHWDEDGIRTRELARLIRGMERKWQARRGGLMPVPKLLSPKP